MKDLAEIDALENDVVLAELRQENLARLTRLLLLDEFLNDSAAEARPVIESVPLAFRELVAAVETAGMPFSLRHLDTNTAVSRERMRGHFARFCVMAFRSLTAVVPEHQRRRKRLTDDEEQLDHLGGPLGRTWWEEPDRWDESSDRIVSNVAEITVQVVEDCGEALKLITYEKSRNACRLLGGRLVELAGLSARASSTNPDQTILERVLKHEKVVRRRSRERRQPL